MESKQTPEPDYLSVLAPSNGEVNDAVTEFKRVAPLENEIFAFRSAVDWTLQWQRDNVNWKAIPQITALTAENARLKEELALYRISDLKQRLEVGVNDVIAGRTPTSNGELKTILTELEIQELKEENERLIQDRDEKEILINALDQFRTAFHSRQWLTEGRGNYTHDDDRYKLEVKYLLDEFEKINRKAWAANQDKDTRLSEIFSQRVSSEVADLREALELARKVLIEDDHAPKTIAKIDAALAKTEPKE